MKKFLVLTLIFALCISFVACTKDDSKVDSSSENSSVSYETSAVITEPITEESTKYVGYDTEVVSIYKGSLIAMQVKFPLNGAVKSYKGMFGYQNNDTVMGIFSWEPERDLTLEETYVQTLDYMPEQFSEFFPSSYVDLTVEVVEDRGTQEHSGYEMRAAKCAIKYNIDGIPYVNQCLLYVSQFKGNGAPFGLVSFDVSDDQSCGDMIQDFADYSLETLYEY